MTTRTIRRNSLKAIRKMLDSAVLITRYSDDGMDCSSDRVTADQVMANAERFRSVTQSIDGNCSSHVTIHSNHFFSVYPTLAAARRCLTADAFRKYFPTEAVAA